MLELVRLAVCPWITVDGEAVAEGEVNAGLTTMKAAEVLLTAAPVLSVTISMKFQNPAIVLLSVKKV